MKRAVDVGADGRPVAAGRACAAGSATAADLVAAAAASPGLSPVRRVRPEVPVLRLVPFLFVVAGCGGVLTPDGTPPRTLFEVGGETRGALDVDGELRAALAWTVTSAELLACLDDVPVDGPLGFTEEDLAIVEQLHACLVFSERGRSETASVALDADLASFTIPVSALPDESLLSGTPDALLGIAHVLVYTDDDGSGAYEETPRGATAFRDRVHGSSQWFRDGDYDVDFVVYREGSLSPLWKLYEALYGCPEPPVGPSTAHVVYDEADDSVACTIDDGAVVVELAADGAAAAMACAADPEAHVVHRPADVEGDALPPHAAAVCEPVDGYWDLYVTETPDSVCPSFRQYALVGCADTTSEQACVQSFWNDLGEEPAWWPCKFGDGTTPALFVEDPAFATDDLDVLFTLSWFDGFGQIDADDLTLVFTMDDEGATRTWERDGLELIDGDGDGAFGVGDRLVVREVVDVFGPDTPFGNYPFTIAGVERWYAPVARPPAPDHDLVVVDAAAPITDGVDEVMRVEYPAGDGDAYPTAGLSVHAYIGGEFPWRVSVAGGGVAVVDVDGDGAFGPGDALRVSEEAGDDGAPLTPDMIASFTGTLYVSVIVDVGFNASVAMGYGTTVVE